MCIHTYLHIHTYICIYVYMILILCIFVCDPLEVLAIKCWNFVDSAAKHPVVVVAMSACVVVVVAVGVLGIVSLVSPQFGISQTSARLHISLAGAQTATATAIGA